MLGLPQDELLGARFGDLVHPNDVGALRDEIHRLLTGEQRAFAAEVRCRNASGIEVCASVSGSLFTVKPPLSTCIILQFQDVTARRRAEGRLQHIANHDALTNLANRNCFMEKLSAAIETRGRDPGHHFAVLFLDVDRFKLVNDSLGHGAGDALLQGVANRLTAQLRPTDLVARFGGDEFAILITECKADEDAPRLAQRIQEVIAEPIQVNGVDISTTASIGITTSSFGYDSPEQVIRDADTAMYRAKSQGRARFAVFDSALHSEVTERLWLEGELRYAIAQGKLALAYQPIFDCTMRSLVGFEALARWEHPQRGAIPPDTFIRIAEETGLIVPLGAWALRTACRTLARWQTDHPGARHLSIHVNVSGAQLLQPGFPAAVQSSLLESGVDASRLVIEITESVLVEKRSIGIPQLEELRSLGVRISLDDFGTGYSSFSMLHELPVDEIKIDRSFVDQIGVSEQGDAVVATMLALGRTLGKTMVAEGIETEQQFDCLVRMGCGRGQGYLLSRPLTTALADDAVERAFHREREPLAEIAHLPRRSAKFRDLDCGTNLDLMDSVSAA
jgi:diguanylate cyclase (GGDEF)-like protein/PAS domain S-box-containing protein